MPRFKNPEKIINTFIKKRGMRKDIDFPKIISKIAARRGRGYIVVFSCLNCGQPKKVGYGVFKRGRKFCSKKCEQVYKHGSYV